MAQVHRFTLPYAVASGHDVFVQGVGFFAVGVLDIPVASVDAVTAAQASLALIGAVDVGVVDNSVTPAPGQTTTGDPYPQYFTSADLVNSVQTGTDPVALALKAAFDAAGAAATAQSNAVGTAAGLALVFGA